MDEVPQPQAATRSIGLGGWIVFVIGCSVLSNVFVEVGAFAGLVLRWPTSWEALVWAIALLWAVSIALAALIMGLLLHLRGRRQWFVAIALTVTISVIPVVVPPLARFLQGV